MTKLFLHSDMQIDNGLNTVYEKAVSESVELYIFSAYLTHWSIKNKPNSSLRDFKFIFGQDFGLSKKVAIRAVLKWLPAYLKCNLMVAQGIQGFHPKAVFWKNIKNECFALIGSSNLTDAAFTTNYEANVVTEISERDFESVKQWANKIAMQSVPVSEDWLDQYQEAEIIYKKSSKQTSAMDNLVSEIPDYNEKLIMARKEQMQNHQVIRQELKSLIKQCAEQKITNDQFYDEFNKLWSWKSENNGMGIGNRFQSKAWTRQGKNADFQKFCTALQEVFEASDKTRDRVVAQKIDWLKDHQVSVRGSVFSEMLCQEYPDKYPVLNDPIKQFLKDNKFKAARGSSEGSQYIDLSMKLRALLAQQSKIKNLAELDVLVQAKYRNSFEIDWK